MRTGSVALERGGGGAAPPQYARERRAAAHERAEYGRLERRAARKAHAQTAELRARVLVLRSLQGRPTAGAECVCYVCAESVKIANFLVGWCVCACIHLP